MTARMIRIDDNYAQTFDKIVASSNGHIEVVDDLNLKLDPFFYERKVSLDKTIEAIDNGTMEMISQDEWDIDMEKLDEEIDRLYAN